MVGILPIENGDELGMVCDSQSEFHIKILAISVG